MIPAILMDNQELFCVGVGIAFGVWAAYKARKAQALLDRIDEEFINLNNNLNNAITDHQRDMQKLIAQFRQYHQQPQRIRKYSRRINPKEHPEEYVFHFIKRHQQKRNYPVGREKLMTGTHHVFGPWSSLKPVIDKLIEAGKIKMHGDYAAFEIL